MVAVRAPDEITDARKVIQRIYDDNDDDVGHRHPHSLPPAVTSHFSHLFFSSRGALDQLPAIDASHPPESYTRGTLVRFRAMIQDTSLQNEMYLARFSDGKCGGWGIQHTHDPNAFDPDCLGTASVLWVVSVPAESPWHAAGISSLDSTSFPVHPPTHPHKFPIPGAPHIGVRVKVYDNANVENLHATDVVTFIGIASSEPLSIEDDSSPEVPVLHVLSYQVDSSNPTTTGIDVTLRTNLIDWLSNEALGGDNDAAEWVLLHLTSKLYSRAIPLLPPSLTLSRFPPPFSPDLTPTISHVLAELLPQYLLIPLSLDLLNKTPFLPESKEEDLHSGYLQLPSGTTILLTESAIQEGQLHERGIMNIRAIQDVMNSQTVDYIFPFSSKFTFNTDLSMIVVSEGSKSAFFQTSVNFPIRSSSSTPGLYRPKNQISWPSAEKITLYRAYIAACKAVSEKVQVTEEASKYIQDDFVRCRQQDKLVTPDELVHLMKVARLVAASQLQSEVTVDVWERAKEIDSRRRTRQCNRSDLYGQKLKYVDIRDNTSCLKLPPVSPVRIETSSSTMSQTTCKFFYLGMSGETTLITQGTQVSLRRVPRKVKAFSDDGETTVFDSEDFAYLFNIDIGGQDFWLTFDTGSSDLWVVSSSCTSDDCQGVPTYSASASSTVRLSNIVFKLNYLLGSVQGVVATETVTVGTIQIVSQTFALANATNALYLKTAGNSGILGLSFPAAATIQPTVGTTVLDNIFSHMSESDRFFAFKLGRNSSEGDASVVDSSATFGKLDSSIVDAPNRTNQLTYFPVFKTPSSPYDYWKLPILNLSINGLLLPLSPSLVPGATLPIAILDTGTTLILGPTQDVNTFWNSVGTGGTARYDAQSNLWEVRCDRAVDVRFAFGQGDGGREYAVHPEDISWAEGKDKDGWCMGGVQINDGVNSGDWLLGDVFLRNVYVVHQGATPSKPPFIGLLGLTNPQTALTDFQSVRGSDAAALPPSIANRSGSEQWTRDAKIATAVSVVGGFLLGGLLTIWLKVRRKSRNIRAARW